MEVKFSFPEIEAILRQRLQGRFGNITKEYKASWSAEEKAILFKADDVTAEFANSTLAECVLIVLEEAVPLSMKVKQIWLSIIDRGYTTKALGTAPLFKILSDMHTQGAIEKITHGRYRGLNKR